jgi:hypothetical protein
MRQGENQSVVVNRRVSQRLFKGLKVVAAAVALFASGQAGAQQLFDWTSDPVIGPAVPAGYTPAPFIPKGNDAAVVSTLAPNPVRAVKVFNDLTPATVGTIFGGLPIHYTFSDFEGAGSVARTAALNAQIRGSAATGPLINTNQAWHGNFDFSPLTNDSTRPGGIAPHGFSDYSAAGLNMANENLYPGNASFRSPLSGNSNAPNLRSSMFTLPVTRLSLTSASIPAGNKHIPYVTRFNNVGNAAFVNGVAPSGQPAFIFDAAHGTAGQLLSRGDFSALIAHYRARGADGVHVLDGGVVGYTPAQYNQDVSDGWHFAPFETIFNGGGAHVATLDTVARVDGVTQTLEASGVVFSGVYSLTQAGGAGKLALLVSNLDDTSHTLSILNKIGGKSIPGSVTVLAGQHKLLDFTGSGSQWQLLNTGGTPVFVDNNRDGVGVPEPTMLGGLALVTCLGLGRRRKAITKA